MQATHIVKLGGEERTCTLETYEQVCEELVGRHGGVPVITPVGSMETRVSMNDAKPGQVSASGAARAEADQETAYANGFAPEDPIFRLGTRVVQAGVENARASQVEHEQKPFAQELCGDLVDRVQAEERNDLPAFDLAHSRMSAKGSIVLPKGGVMDGARLPINEKTFHQLMGRLPCPSGSQYLSACPTKLRAINYNHWALHCEEQEIKREVVLRTRVMRGERAAYAAVSPKYTPFDADQIGQALRMAFPSDAKGSLDYDGRRLRVEGLWHTDVAPEEFVAGEIFKAGVIVRSDDTGSGSVRVQSVIWRNLCLNLIILDEAIGVDVRLRHTGGVENLAAQFREAFSQALTSVNAFRVAWTRARAEADRELIEAVQGTTREKISGLPAEAVLPGIFSGIVKRDLVPVRGRVEEVVPKLMEMHRQDEAADQYGVSRASIVNAFTRYAHQVEADPFRADNIRQGAGALLSGHRGREPAPLPYVSTAL